MPSAGSHLPGDPSVDADDRAGGVAGRRTGQVQREGSDLLGLAQPAQRDERPVERLAGAYASARPTVSALRPALAQAYGSSLTLATSEPAVPTLMIDPPPWAAMCVAASTARRNGPFRFTARVLS
jgi:hypothetical protein